MIGYQEDVEALLDQELVVANIPDKNNIQVYRIEHHLADENKFNSMTGENPML